MTATPSATPGQSLPPAPLTGRLGMLWRLLLTRRAGQVLLCGAALKLLAAADRLVVRLEPVWMAVLDTLGSLALIAATGYLLYRLLLRVRRRLLWRVRRKLILSYVFIGLVPAFLIVSFFVVSGLILFLNVASYLVTNGFGNVASEAVYLARMAAIEIQRTGPEQAGQILEQREAALVSRYPGASMVLVPTAAGPEPCVGSPAAGPRVGQVGGLVAATHNVPATPARGQAAARGPIEPLAVGPWEHLEPPQALPRWVSCAGFGGIVSEPLEDVTRRGTGGVRSPSALIVVRGVGLPDTARPAWAVIVDIPKNTSLEGHLRDETSVKVGDVNIVVTDQVQKAWQERGRSLLGRMRDELLQKRAPAGGAKQRLRWVASLEGIDWPTGVAEEATLQIEVNIADIYDRLSSAQLTTYNFASLLLGLLAFVVLLFLLIEAGALVMGLALARSITGSVHELFAGTEHVRQGDFSHRIEVRTHDQLGELADSFNQMTASIEDLLRQADEKRRLEEELRIAREVQMSLLPRGQLRVPGLSVTALCVPARQVGGDYYDFLPLDGDRLGVLIADVSGKGTSAAFYMAELKGVILSLSRTCRSPRELLLAANQVISRSLDNRSFITMTYAVLDVRARTLTYARAGHTPLIHRHARAASAPRVDVLAPDGLVLGLRIDGGEMFTRLLQEVTLPLECGDLLMLFTDGMSEAMNAESDLFGEARLAELVGEHGHLPVEELRERILREVDAFVAGAPQHDDMTMILLKVDEFVPGAITTGFDDGRS